MKTFALSLCLSALALAVAAPAQAQIFVHDSGAPYGCFQSVKTGNLGSISAIRTCDEGIREATLRADVAATHVNRGVLFMRKGETEKAIEDFEKGLKIRPEMSEAYINLGAALYFADRYDEALTALNTALEMNTEKRADALFNRALVLERQGDIRAAYYDLKEAIELRPDWDLADRAISRFSVTRSTS